MNFPSAGIKKHDPFFSSSRIIFFVLAALIFFFAVHYVGKLIDIEKLFMEMSPAWLLLAFAAQAGTYLLNALIMKKLLPNSTARVNYFTLIKLSMVIMFVNQAIPTGGISGNDYLYNELVKRKVPRPKVFTALILESLCYYVAILILLTIFYPWYVQGTARVTPLITYTVITGYLFYILLGIAVLLLSNRDTITFVLQKLGHIGWVRRYIQKKGLLPATGQHESTYKMFASNERVIGLIVLMQAGIIMCDVVTAFALIKGFHIDLSFTLVTFAVLLSLIIGALPISPGSLIIYESAMTFFLTKLGAPAPSALIITLLYRVLTFWLPIPIGLLLYRNIQLQDKHLLA